MALIEVGAFLYRLWFQGFFFHDYLGGDSYFDIIFLMGWNHQLVSSYSLPEKMVPILLCRNDVFFSS